MRGLEAWSPWRPFPNPKRRGILIAPFGPGCYELRRSDTGQKLLFGEGKNVALRMTSLLPSSAGGAGERSNAQKRKYVAAHLTKVEYRTCACIDGHHAKAVERKLKRARGGYLFST